MEATEENGGEFNVEKSFLISYKIPGLEVCLNGREPAWLASARP